MGLVIHGKGTGETRAHESIDLWVNFYPGFCCCYINLHFLYVEVTLFCISVVSETDFYCTLHEKEKYPLHSQDYVVLITTCYSQQRWSYPDSHDNWKSFARALHIHLELKIMGVISVLALGKGLDCVLCTCSMKWYLIEKQWVTCANKEICNSMQERRKFPGVPCTAFHSVDRSLGPTSSVAQIHFQAGERGCG